jgi:hypothetical protein
MGKQPTKSAPVRDYDRELWLEFHRGWAPTVNRVGVSYPHQGAVRISFAEQYDAEALPSYRGAVVLSDWNAYQLMKILAASPTIQAMADLDREVETSEEEASPPPDDNGQG